ncbi:MAG: hypothetical protein NTX81_01760, partial [Candidatus Bathyarchaeota archaeon]|nr:hypothetical protein [Candidatus Bathyarchaeota archaeon]
HFSALTETDILQTLAEWLNPITEGIKGWGSYAELLETFLDNDYHPVFQFGPVETDGCSVKWTE